MFGIVGKHFRKRCRFCDFSNDFYFFLWYGCVVPFLWIFSCLAVEHSIFCTICNQVCSFCKTNITPVPRRFQVMSLCIIYCYQECITIYKNITLSISLILLPLPNIVAIRCARRYATHMCCIFLIHTSRCAYCASTYEAHSHSLRVVIITCTTRTTTSSQWNRQDY